MKPIKKHDAALYRIIEQKIATMEYRILPHANKRKRERNISDLDIINILEGKRGYGRKRNKSKDKYEPDREDWNYCIEGQNKDNEKIRIIISFEKNLMPIITVIRINNHD